MVDRPTDTGAVSRYVLVMEVTVGAGRSELCRSENQYSPYEGKRGDREAGEGDADGVSGLRKWTTSGSRETRRERRTEERERARIAGEADAVNPARTTDWKRSVTTRNRGAEAEWTFYAVPASASAILLVVEGDAAATAEVDAGVEPSSRTTCSLVWAAFSGCACCTWAFAERDTGRDAQADNASMRMVLASHPSVCLTG